MAGKRQRSSSNRERRILANRERYAVRLDFLRRFKRFKGCACGCRDWRCLTIDHMEGKSRDISKCASIAAMKEEIRRHKCVVRCANCHMIRTYEEQSGRPALDRLVTK